MSEEINPFQLVVGVTASNLDSSAALLDDLSKLCEERLLTKLVICTDSDASQSVESRLESFRRRGVGVRFVQREEIVRSAKDGIFGEYYVESARQGGIAFFRTALHHFLYIESAGLLNPVVWVLDDDIRIDESTYRPKGGSPSPLLELFRSLKSGGADIAVGRIAGDPPIPGASMTRTQLLDLSFNLAALTNPHSSIDQAELVSQMADNMRRYPDFYYDLTLLHSGHLETPWWFIGTSSPADRLRSLNEMLEKVPLIRQGVNIFRQIPAPHPELDAAAPEIPTRGGNTIIFDIECLREYPNVSPQIGGLTFRRGDTLWVVLNKRLNARGASRKVVSTDFSVRQDRRFCRNSIFDSDILLSDIFGGALTRAVDRVLSERRRAILEGGPHNDNLCFDEAEISKAIDAFDELVKERFALLELNSWRIQGLIDSIRTQVRATIRSHGPEGAILRAHADQLEQFLSQAEETFSPDAFRKLKAKALSFPRGELASFLRDLGCICESYRDRLSKPRIPEGDDALRFLRARFGDRRFEPLAKGNEGEVLTDGSKVYKYFHSGVENFREGQLEFLQNALSPASIGGFKHIAPLENLVRDGSRVVFVSRLVKGNPYSGGFLGSLLGLMKECRDAGIVLTNISPENLLVNGHSLAYVDLGRSIESFTEQGFESMCRRAFLVYKWGFRSDLKELLRRSIHDTTLPELFGFEHFLNSLVDRHVHEVIEPVLLPMVLRDGPETVFDYGCGDGGLDEKLVKDGARVTAYDIDAARYKNALHSVGVSFVGRGKLRSLLEKSATFDVVLCSMVLCTIEDQSVIAEVLSDLRRLVRERGTVILALCNPFNLENRESETHIKKTTGTERYAEHSAYLKFTKGTRGVRKEFHRPFSWYSAMIRRAGLEVDEIEEVPGTDIQDLRPGSDFILLRLRPAQVPTPSNVSLLIKASAMEWRTVRKQILHLVRQLEAPRLFLEKVVILDDHEGPFPRQYDTTDLESVRRELSRLVSEGVVDRVVAPPVEDGWAVELNRKWFGLRAPATRCQNGQPTLTTIYGIEQCRGEYVLHVDDDCLIGRPDREHDYLAEILGVFERDPFAVTASLPVAGTAKKWTSCDEKGKWRTEVRCGVVSKPRLADILPLPNDLGEDGLLRHPWHRTLDLRLETSGCQSYRGGGAGIFFIHVPNERKKGVNRWYNIMKAVEQGRFFETQAAHPDLMGEVEDWLPKRPEKCVLVVRGRNVPLSKLRRCFDSISRQIDQDWGLLVIDAGSDNGMDEYIEEVIGRRYGERLTFYRNLIPEPPIVNIYFALRHLCSKASSIIVMPDADDSFIGDDAIDYVKQVYQKGADVAVGGMVRADKDVHYQADFDEPRRNRGGNVWQPLRTFRKHLFDSISPEDLKVDGEWVPHTEDWSFMLPIVEMATTPVQFERTIYLYEPSPLKQTLAKEERERLIAEIVGKPSYGGF